MKLGKLLIVASLLIGSTAYGQMTDCERFLGVANNAYAEGNFPEAISYYKKSEGICDSISKGDYDRLIASYRKMMDQVEYGGKDWKDSLVTVVNYYELLIEKGMYDSSEDVTLGYYYTQLPTPNYLKADKYLSRGIKTEGTNLYDENFITLYYFNTYTLWYIELDDAKKAEYKQRLIKDYFEMSKLIKDANFAPSIQEGLTGYLSQVITSCEDLAPEIPVFIESLPEDMESKKTALKNMAALMSQNNCEDTDEYKTVAKTLYDLDPKDPESQIIYVGLLPCGERIAVYREIKSNTEDVAKKNSLQYEIARCQMSIGSYKAAYSSAKAVSGENKGKALEIMGKCVGATANSCGVSTFDRNCNYIYAAQLLEQAQANGATGLSQTIAKYQGLAPNANACFDNGNPTSVSLECWGVTVNPCK